MTTLTLDKIAVREAAPADDAALLAAIDRVHEETAYLGAPGERPSLDHLQAQRDGGGVSLIAVENSAVVGYLGASVEPITACRGSCYIYSVGLRANHRGRGIGSRLLDAMEDWARARGAWRLGLNVVVDNARALALYRRHGFVVEGRNAGGFAVDGVPCDSLHMAKTLVAPTGAPSAPVDLQLGRAPYPPAVTVRPLVPGDGAALLAFERARHDGPPVYFTTLTDLDPDPAMLERRIAAQHADARHHALVALDAQRRVVAHAHVRREPWQRLAHVAYARIMVLRPWWGCGIGSALAERLEAWSAAQRVQRLVAITTGHNLRGRRFATARGFRLEITSPSYARRGDLAIDRIQMMRPGL